MIDRVAVERWIAWIRLGGVAFAALEIGLFTSSFPAGYEPAAWALTGAFAAGALFLFALAQTAPTDRLRAVGFAALVFDTAVIGAYAVIFTYEYGNQTRFALVLAVLEAALRYGLAGGVGLPLALVPFFWFVEWWRVHKFPSNGPTFLSDRVSFPAGLLLLAGLIAGWLVTRLEVAAASEGLFATQVGRAPGTATFRLAPG